MPTVAVEPPDDTGVIRYFSYRVGLPFTGTLTEKYGKSIELSPRPEPLQEKCTGVAQEV